MSIATERPLWPHQAVGICETIAAIEAGEGPICATSPTGGGKSEMIFRLIEWACELGWQSVIYTNRKMLREQLTDDMTERGIDYGVRASGIPPALLRNVQVSSIQTERARVYGSEKWKLHDAKLVIIDEAHCNAADTAQKIIAEHRAAGAAVVGFTATPLGIGHVYEKLIVAGTNSELRECGALVPCHTYGPDEPDMKNITRQKSGEYSEKDVRKKIMTTTIFARVLEWYGKLNPDQRPAILFAPDVAGSLWFAEQLTAAGIRAAHIDGNDIWLDGESYSSTREGRDDILAGSEDGTIKVICNRFVLREGINAPWLYHAIFATVFGALQSYLQSGGRLLRAHPGLDHVVLQDHGGNWWRHGSLNADREWKLELNDYVTGCLREDRIRNGKEVQPIICPACAAVRSSGDTCWKCGHRASGKSRMVVQTNGKLKMMTGDVYPKRYIKREPDTAAIYEACYRRCRNGKKDATHRQVRGLFVYENHYWPPADLPFMPKCDEDWHRGVKEVSMSDLIQKGLTIEAIGR